MRNPKTRFIGGPLHGELKAVNSDARWFEMMVDSWMISQLRYDQSPYPYASGIHTMRYERRKLSLSGNTLVEFMVPADMSTAEAERRLADFIEGCGTHGR